MTKKEAAQVLAILKAAYPNFYKDMGAEEAQGTISVWSMQFADLSSEIVLMALNKHISVGKFPPTIAEIKEKITSIYWEAYDKAYPICENVAATEKERQLCERICRETEGYKYKDRNEPTLSQLILENNVKHLPEG